MRIKPVRRLTPELDNLIEEAKRDAARAYNIDERSIPKISRGINQIAQMKVAEWAKLGKEAERNRPPFKSRFKLDMDRMCK